ncbi:restriction endonuclease subunit S [Glaesserella parasuis]|nr:restriction endonuclease subunit S [Glaesserella parasuis]MDP0261677.1 restriction endonuclease subunit S [Glaesserella parasuis]
MSSWKKVTLEDISESINTGLDAIRRAPIVDFETDIKCLRIQDISQNKPIESWGFTEVKNTDYSKFRLMKDDIIMARTCSTGICFLAKQDLPAVFNNGLARIRLKKDIAYPTYVYYVFKSKSFISYIDGISGGTSVQLNMKIGDLSKYSFDLPPLNIQKEIANKLSDLDKKIQLNTQINQTLEQIAQTIFKSWFIDFDPVHAKANALASGQTLEQATQAAMAVISGKNTQELHRLQTANPKQYQQLWEIAEAFPSGVDEEGVPWGWEEKPLPELIDFLEGPGIRNWQYTEEEDGIKFINIRCIKNGDLSLETANKITREEAFGKYAHFQLKEDDIVISTSGTLGRFALVRNEHLPLCLNTSVIRFRPIENKSTLAFLLGLASNQLQYELEARASGSVQRNFGPTHLKQISVLLPDFYLLSLHNKYISTLFELRKSNLRENDLLMKTRDVLLPKLLSGEV